MGKVKVAIVCSSFAVGGAENMVAQLIANLNPDEVDLTPILTCPRSESHVQSLVDQVGIKCIYLSRRSKKSNFDRLKIMVSMWKTLRTISPDVIHTNLSCVVYCIPYVLSHRARLLHTVHSTPERDLAPWLRFILRFLIRMRKARLISISHRIQAAICCTYRVAPNEAPVIYNPVDVKKFEVRRKGRTQEIVFTNVGRLTEEKNHSMLLEAFQSARRECKNIRLQIVGEGELEHKLKQKAQMLGIDTDVAFMGNRKDIPEILANSDVFILSSVYEGLPLAILEAMAAGLPIISTDVGGISDVIRDNENGLLIRELSVEELTRAILLLANDPDLRNVMGAKSRTLVRKYDVGLFAENYYRQYIDLSRLNDSRVGI